jgi:hypothetical protein
MTPKLMPPPRRPSAVARSSGVVTSETAAWQAAMLPAVAPATIRDAKRSGNTSNLLASANATIESTLPARLTRITRLLPNRSDMRPSTGVASSCVNEKHPKRIPTVSADPPISFT